MDAIPRITDNDVRRRGQLRRFFSRSGFLVGAASDGLECLTETVTLEPDVLVIALAIPQSAAVVARWDQGWSGVATGSLLKKGAGSELTRAKPRLQGACPPSSTGC